MARKIFILEDNEGRIAVMGEALASKFPQYEAVFQKTPLSAIDYLKAHWDEILAISLDHDMDLIPDDEGRWIDPGLGREVADYLAGREPRCSVVVHTTNSLAGDGMELALKGAGWTVYRVIPFDDTSWITSTWRKAIRKAIMDSVQHKDMEQR